MHAHAHGVVRHTRSAALRDVVDVGYGRWRDGGSWDPEHHEIMVSGIMTRETSGWMTSPECEILRNAMQHYTQRSTQRARTRPWRSTAYAYAVSLVCGECGNTL
jgi:hypothetical protein